MDKAVFLEYAYDIVGVLALLVAMFFSAVSGMLIESYSSRVTNHSAPATQGSILIGVAVAFAFGILSAFLL